MRLVYKDSIREVQIGDLVALRDGDAEIQHFRPPHKSNSIGKVSVSYLNKDWTQEFYTSVIGAEWIDREDRPANWQATDAPTVRDATLAELIAIRNTLSVRYCNDELLRDRVTLQRDEIMVRENYISDGPGFAGKLAVIFWGEPQFLTVLGDNGSTDTNWQTIDPEI
jgi:hypothetical protein